MWSEGSSVRATLAVIIGDMMCLIDAVDLLSCSRTQGRLWFTFESEVHWVCIVEVFVESEPTFDRARGAVALNI